MNSFRNNRQFFSALVCILTLHGLLFSGVLYCQPLEQDIQRQKLANGVTLITSVRQNRPLASVQLWIRSGRVEDPPELKGAAEIIARLLGGPVIRRRLADTVPSLLTEGVKHSFACFDDSMVIELKGPSSRVAEMAETLSRMVLQPQFTSEEFDAARQLLADELEKQSNDEFSQLEQQLLHLCYSIHPYRNHALDALQNLFSITANQISAEIKRRLAPENLTITSCGTGSGETFSESATIGFQQIRQAPLLSRPAIIEPKPVTRRVFVSRGTYSRNKVMLGYVTPPSQSFDVYTFMLLSELLEGDSTSELRHELMSLLPDDAEVEVSFRPRRDPGLFTITISGKDIAPDKVGSDVATILWKARDNYLRLSDIARAKERLKTLVTQRFSTPDSEARELGLWAVLEHRVSYEKIIEAIDSVSVPQVSRIIEEYFNVASVAMAVQSRILLKPAMTLASSLKSPEIIDLKPDKLSPNLRIIRMNESPLTACNILISVEALRKDSQNIEGLLSMRKFLKETFINPPRQKEVHFSDHNLAGLKIFPRTLSEPPDAVRIEFSSPNARFLKLLGRILSALQKSFHPSFTSGCLAPSDICVSIAGNQDDDLCRKAVAEVFSSTDSVPDQQETNGQSTDFTAVEAEAVTGELKDLRANDKAVIAAKAPRLGASLEASTLCFSEILRTRVLEKLNIKEGLVKNLQIYYHREPSSGNIHFVIEHTSKKKALVLTNLLNEFKLLAEHECSVSETEQGISSCRMSLLESIMDPVKLSLMGGLSCLRNEKQHFILRLASDLKEVTPSKVQEAAKKILSTAEPVYR